MPVLKNSEKLILGAAATLMAVGGALAVAQPGDLGGEEAAGPSITTTTSTTISTTTTTTDAGATTTTTAAPSVGDDPVVGAPPGGEAPVTTIAGSGLGQGGAPSGGTDGIANTGGESMLGAGLALGALGLLAARLRRLAR